YRTTRYSANVTYFNNNYRNFISQEFIANAPGLGLVAQALNFARVRIQGLEADGEYSFNLGNSTVTPFLTMAYTHGNILEAVNPFNQTSLRNVPADNISPLRAIAGLRWNDGRGRFWAEYNVRAQANVDRVSPLLKDSPFLIAQDLLSLRGFGIQNLRGGYNFTRENGRVALTFGLENAANNFYREQFQFAPSRGRTLTIGLLFKYF
ncbi:MAG: TonB-dependent receptor, partial [Acidobacteria bacterium]|nr:TonB-dependent receptor [Acidobacteriota bacterium]